MKLTERQKSIKLKHSLAEIHIIAHEMLRLNTSDHSYWDIVHRQTTKSLNHPTPEDLQKLHEQHSRVCKEIEEGQRTHNDTNT